MEMLFVIHSHMRWLVLLVAAVALVVTARTWIAKKTPGKIDGLATRLHAIMLTLQFLTGIITLVNRWGLDDGLLRYRMEHTTLMLVALTMSHLTGRWRGTPVATRNAFLMVVGSVILVLLAILVLPQGAARLGLG
ncbi:MAG: hypothetical protein FGM24_04590 [Candidatus Kapabacteria bacterium]|nr:hypothetical protein [Candidatus Kapabacteria bacterium]